MLPFSVMFGICQYSFTKWTATLYLLYLHPYTYTVHIFLLQFMAYVLVLLCAASAFFAFRTWSKSKQALV